MHMILPLESDNSYRLTLEIFTQISSINADLYLGLKKLVEASLIAMLFSVWVTVGVLTWFYLVKPLVTDVNQHSLWHSDDPTARPESGRTY